MYAIMPKIDHFAHILLADLGLSEASIKQLIFATLLIFGCVFFMVGTRISHWLLNIVLTRLSKKNRRESAFIQALSVCKVPHHLANLVPIMLLGLILPIFRTDFPAWLPLVSGLVDAVFILFVLQLLGAFLKAMCRFLKTQEHYRDKPLESYAQIIMLVLYFVALAFLYIKFTNKSLTGFFGTLGAVSAVLLLIFKDTIMGIVASIQVSMNDMVRVGDWITMNSYGADGDVIEINLTTVKVSNFDKTVTTIPTYALIANSFQNWRYMFDAQCRRIKRSIIIRPTTVKYLSPEDVERMKKIQLIAHYITEKQADIDLSNQKNNADKTLMINGRNLTNFGLFRKYIDAYLHQNSAINKEMTLIVRQLQPTEYGFPLEIYAFSKDPRWANYEYIQADIFDHIIAAAPYFDLGIYEYS